MFAEFVDLMDKFFFPTADKFGGKVRSDKLNYVKRKNINDPFPDTGAYFGCINEGEEPSGPYSDLSIVVFPSNEKNIESDRWIVALVIGSLGFKNDFDIATVPGTRRAFSRCLQGAENAMNSFIKNDFLDTNSRDGFRNYCEANCIPETLSNAVKSYEKVILAATIFDPNNEKKCQEIIELYLALYATIRGWPSNKDQRKMVKESMPVKSVAINEEREIRELLESRKYIVLQGAPGTGKTRMAKKIIEDCPDSIVFFTQFHAETSYSDFVYGILPDTTDELLKYKAKKGVLVKAIETAQMERDKKVYLIIDEINRANLSNVLGPAFYLFEPTMSDSKAGTIQICPELSLDKLPDNFYVIATMNTADRSLAVVDFALRRRFAWYTMIPHEIKTDENYKFCTEEFNAIREIFEEYATDEELNLQPGQAYFVVKNGQGKDKDTIERAEMGERLKYEVMPLIKEYLVNGMLSRSKDDFVNYFRHRIHTEMFR